MNTKSILINIKRLKKIEYPRKMPKNRAGAPGGEVEKWVKEVLIYWF
jgi:hypothetical protein